MSSLSEKEKSIYNAVGRVAIESGRVESRLAELADLLVNPNEPFAGQAFTTDIPLSRLIDATLWLYDKRNGKRNKALKSLLERVSTLSKERNEIIHSDWLIRELPGLPYIPLRRRFENQNRKGPVFRRQVVNTKNLNLLADKFSSIVTELNSFILEVWDEHEPAT